MISKAEYRVQLQSIFNLAALVRGLKIRDVIEAMDRAETVGPIVDPTLYLQAADTLDWQRQIAHAALVFQRAIERIIDDHSH